MKIELKTLKLQFTRQSFVVIVIFKKYLIYERFWYKNTHNDIFLIYYFRITVIYKNPYIQAF